MTDSTSIADLPADPTGGSPTQNISLNISEKPQTNNGSNGDFNPASLSLDQTTINQIVNGLQKASTTGATQLPSRDIPRETESMVNDPYIQPNYIPPPQPQQKDYISDYEKTDDIINNYNKDAQRSNTLDEMYDELQTPILLAALFFLFQLPFFKKILFKYASGLFALDGQYNLNGYIFMSILFGFVYYFFSKTVNYFGAF
jgi:hypothetical protein